MSHPTPPPGNHDPVAPSTPHHVRNSDPINEIIRSLESAWKLGLQVRGPDWSPSTGPMSTSKAGKINGYIKYLYYKKQTTLYDKLNEFSRVAPELSSEERRDRLLALLSASMREATTQTPRTVVAHSIFPSQLSGQGSRSPQPGDAQSNGQGSSSYATAQEDGSATDDDEDGYVMPSSPTTSSKAAQRRVQGSPRVVFNPAGRKRLSDSSVDNVSPKLLKTSRGGRQSPVKDSAYPKPQGANSNVLFKKPSVDLLRSSQSASKKASFTDSMNMSFNTDSTPTSSQLSATQPFTANTSFTSDKYDEEAGRSITTRTNSTAMGSGLDDEDSMDPSAQLRREISAQIAREHLQSSGNVVPDNLQSSGNEMGESTFGSVDEEALAETSFRIESDMYGFGPGSSPTRRVLWPDNARSGTPPSSQTLHSKTGALPKSCGPIRHGSPMEVSPARRILQPRSPRVGNSTTKPALVQAFTSSNMQQQSLNDPSPFNTVPPHLVEFATNMPETLQPCLVAEPSPPKPIVKFSPSRDQAQSPTKMSHHISGIPNQNLFVEDIADDLKHLPYFILFICRRIASERKIDMWNLAKNLRQRWSEADSFWDAILEQCPQARVQESKSLWSAEQRAFDGYTFKGRVVFNGSLEGPVFNLELLPVAADTSCRFQRRFGADRFLYLNCPSFESGKTSPVRFTQNDMRNIQQHWNEWFTKEHSFIGRKWRAFHVEPITKKSGSRKVDLSDKRIVLFATEGCGIKEPLSVGKMIDWFIPLAGNANQSFCKAFARLDLGLSRTTPTITFKPAQVRYVDDKISDDNPEDTVFNDQNLLWDERPDENNPPVMNDGCSRISVAAAQKIWKVLGLNDPVPSVFQGRILGAKGMWMVSAETFSRDAADQDVWIEISTSQLKFQPHPEDRIDGEGNDACRLTFEVRSYSRPPRPSDLHISFIPILVDRGVPKDIIASIMKEQLDIDRQHLLEIVPDAARLYDWVCKQSAMTGDIENSSWQAGLPQSFGGRVRLLLESGFSPVKSPYLARSLERFIRQELISREKKLRVPLPKSTYLYGVADPLGVLAPGEVHLSFSKTFFVESTGENFPGLHDLPGLIARQPACRRSDIQKVRFVVHPALLHLQDCAVFPIRGPSPLASKLQGGDYDGDQFWMTWEPALVDLFKNAPAPLNPLKPSDYGIRQDTRKLKDIMDPYDLSTIDRFLREVLTFRTSGSLLGFVTNFLEKQAYTENRVYSHSLNELCALHDLLVDAPKNAYTFTNADFQIFLRRTIGGREPKLPTWKKAIEAYENATEMGETDKLRKKDWKENLDNILDYLFFKVVQVHNNMTFDMLTEVFANVEDKDSDLEYPFVQQRQKNNSVIQKELDALEEACKALYLRWISGMKGGSGRSTEHLDITIEVCYQRFQAIIPVQIDDPSISPWVEPYLSKDSLFWDKLRASALYTLNPIKKRAPFVFHMAGKELAKLKSGDSRGKRDVASSIYDILKPKIARARTRIHDEGSDEDFVMANEGT